MPTLTHYRLCPFSRAIRAVLGELGIEVTLIEEQPWAWRPQLLALNPAGDLPVLEFEGGPILCGSYSISEYVNEEVERHPGEARPLLLFPGNREERAEVRRLVDWFHRKFEREVTRWLLEEKVYRQQQGAGTPEVEVVRAARANLRYHMSYVSFLTDQRSWLAGNELSYADFAAAGHISSVDYLGEVPWEEYPHARLWYARMKSRRAFRVLLADRLPGLPPPLHYDNPDF